MTVHFQFEGDASPAEQKATVSGIENQGARRVKRSFPRVKNPNLPNLRAAEVEDDKAYQIARMLNADKHAGFVEIPPESSI